MGGYTKRQTVGRLVVLHDSTGARISCAVIPGKAISLVKVNHSTIGRKPYLFHYMTSLALETDTAAFNAENPSGLPVEIVLLITSFFSVAIFGTYKWCQHSNQKLDDAYEQF